MKNKKSILKTIILATPLVLMSSPTPTFAVQQHGGPEGLVAHQIGHILFISGMTYLLFRVQHNRITGPGWFQFKVFLWLIILWNFLTFSGHWMMEFVNPENFVKEGSYTTGFIITSFSDMYFYLTLLDHILLVPCFVFLLIALQKWRRFS